MAVHSGTQGSVIYSSANGTVGTIVGGMKTWTITVEAEELDTSSFDQSWRNFDSGIKQWGGTFEGNKDASNAMQQALWAQLVGGTKVEATFFLGTASKYYGTIVVLGEEPTQSFDSFGETSYTSRGDGTLGTA